jgi:hypothetical protein
MGAEHYSAQVLCTRRALPKKSSFLPAPGAAIFSKAAKNDGFPRRGNLARILILGRHRA